MELNIKIEWWENEGQDEIPEQDLAILIPHAITRVHEMAGENSDGYCAGELNQTVNGTQYNGSWEVQEKRK